MNTTPSDPQDMHPSRSDRVLPPMIEAFEFADRLLLHNRNSGAAVLSDDLGVAVLSALFRGHETDALTAIVAKSKCATHEAGDVLEGLRAAWGTSGLLAEAPPHPSEDTIRRAAVKHWHVVDLGVGDHRLRVRCESEDVADRTARTFAEHLQASSEGVTHTVDMLDAGGLPTVIRDGRPVWRAPDAEAARLVLFQEIIGILAGEDQVGAIVHGALLERDGASLVLAGPSGRGKTTLALALAGKGWTYSSDDLFALRHDGRSAISLPTHAHRKPSSIGDASAGRDYMVPDKVTPTGAVLPIAHLLFPTYRPGSLAARSELPTVEVAQALLQSGTEPLRRHRSIASIVALARHVPAMALTYGTTEDALAACEALTDTTSPGDR